MHFSRRHRYLLAIGFVLLLVSLTALALTPSGNRFNDSFTKSKKILENNIYYDNRVTVYCGIEFNAEKHTALPPDFDTSKYSDRAQRIEWEHIVPAENFGRTFTEWREGHPDCCDIKGKTFKGRKCAEKANAEYRYMQADMYNLYPAVGSVNAARSNYNFTQLSPEIPAFFGSCPMKIDNRKVEPPAPTRGVIARTYLYFEGTYSRYRMSAAQRQLMTVWDKQYPVTEWECRRACRIEKIQQNENTIVKERCQNKGLWPQGDAC